MGHYIRFQIVIFLIIFNFNDFMIIFRNIKIYISIFDKFSVYFP